MINPKTLLAVGDGTAGVTAPRGSAGWQPEPHSVLLRKRHCLRPAHPEQHPPRDLDRVFAVQFVVRVQAGSTEFANLITLTTGTATFTMTRDVNNSFSMLIQKMGFNVVELGNTDGIATLQITGVQLYDATNGLVTMTVVTPQNNICQ